MEYGTEIQNLSYSSGLTTLCKVLPEASLIPHPSKELDHLRSAR